MPLPSFRSGVDLSGHPRFYPVRDDRGRVVGYAQGAGGQARRDHNPGQAPSAARPSASGGPRVRPAPVPPPTRAVRPVSYLEAARAPLGIARSARSAPSVVRWSDLRAMTAAGRARPQPVERQQLEREYLPRQRAINITYSVVVPQAAAPPGPAVDIPPAHETIGEQLASTAAEVGRAAAEVAASHPVLTQADLDAATKRGEVVTQKQLTKAKKVVELSKLLAVLPLGALAKVCNASVAELAGMDADGLARHFVTRGRRSMWSVGQARDCRNTWARFMVFLDQRGIVHDGMSFKATDVGDFLEHVDHRTRAPRPQLTGRGRWRRTRRRQPRHVRRGGLPPSRAGGRTGRMLPRESLPSCGRSAGTSSLTFHWRTPQSTASQGLNLATPRRRCPWALYSPCTLTSTASPA